jgi:hypothetical protein
MNFAEIMQTSYEPELQYNQYNSADSMHTYSHRSNSLDLCMSSSSVCKIQVLTLPTCFAEGELYIDDYVRDLKEHTCWEIMVMCVDAKDHFKLQTLIFLTTDYFS